MGALLPVRRESPEIGVRRHNDAVLLQGPGENILVPIAKLDSEKGKTIRRFHRECRKNRKRKRA